MMAADMIEGSATPDQVQAQITALTTRLSSEPDPAAVRRSARGLGCLAPAAPAADAVPGGTREQES
jgi:hypothetical protein